MSHLLTRRPPSCLAAGGQGCGRHYHLSPRPHTPLVKTSATRVRLSSTTSSPSPAPVTPNPIAPGGAAAAAAFAAALAAVVAPAAHAADAVAVAAAATTTTTQYVPSPLQIPEWQIWVGSAVGVFPFAIGLYEFVKRIQIQRRCKVCGGSGLVMRGPEGRQLQRKCLECGGFFPWRGWGEFLSATAQPGNGGPLLAPRGQKSVFYSVPPPPSSDDVAGLKEAVEAASRRASSAPSSSPSSSSSSEPPRENN